MFVKICCISAIREAELALESGADAIGLVSNMPSGPGIISESLISEIATNVGDRCHSVLLTSLSNPTDIASQFARCRVNALQLCEWLPPSDRLALRKLLPEAFIIQVVHVIGATTIDRARDSQDSVDALLLDSGSLTETNRELGGTGRTHDWEMSRQIVELVGIPVLLAGGLHHSNACSAIEAVKPYGLDVCSGVRTGGNLDPAKLRMFLAGVC